MSLVRLVGGPLGGQMRQCSGIRLTVPVLDQHIRCWVYEAPAWVGVPYPHLINRAVRRA